MAGTSSALFRHDAIAAFARRGFGAAIGTHHRLGLVAGLLLLLPMLGLIVVAVAATYQPRMTVSGRIISGSGQIDVAADRSGVVRSLLIDEGEPVQRGEALMAFGSITGNTTRANLDTAQQQTLLAELEHLNSLRDIIEQKSASWLEGFELAVQSIRRELAVLDSLQNLADNRVELLQRTHARTRRLSDSGHAPHSQRDASELQWLDARMQARTLEREQLALHSRLREQQVERTAAMSRFRDQELDLDIRSAQLHRQLLELEARAESVLLSPASGRIGVIFVRTGASVTAGQPVISIVPADPLPRAELLVPSAHISLIAPGQDVRLRYAGLPIQRFGNFPGKIAEIGATPVNRSAEHGPLYRVLVELTHPLPTQNGRSLRLFPGSTLEADILGPKIAVWRRLVAPLQRSGLLP